jgi:hypothetical protein
MAERETITAAPPRARQSNKLTARQIASAKPGRHGDGGGLYLVVSRTGARKWIFRFTSGGKPNEMGVGGAAVTLAQARDRAADARKFVASGVNPITARREARMASAAKPTFGQCAEALLAARSSEWRNARHRAQWRMTLETYAGPLCGTPVDQVDTAAVLGRSATCLADNARNSVKAAWAD